jgi:hypothetical protein
MGRLKVKNILLARVLLFRIYFTIASGLQLVFVALRRTEGVCFPLLGQTSYV